MCTTAMLTHNFRNRKKFIWDISKFVWNLRDVDRDLLSYLIAWWWNYDNDDDQEKGGGFDVGLSDRSHLPPLVCCVPVPESAPKYDFREIMTKYNLPAHWAMVTKYFQREARTYLRATSTQTKIHKQGTSQFKLNKSTEERLAVDLGEWLYP